MAEQNNENRNVETAEDMSELLKIRRQKLADLQAAGKDPFIITKYDGLDPEVPGGVDKNPYPRPWSLQFGMSLNF